MDTLNLWLDSGEIKTWVLALGAGAGTYLVLVTLKRLLLYRLRRLIQTTKNPWDDILLDVVRTAKNFFFIVLSIYVATRFETLSPSTAKTLKGILLVGVIAQVWIWGGAVISGWVEHYVTHSVKEDGSKATTIRAAGFITRLLFYVLLFLWGLDNFGVNITTLIAGLGVGGIAVALAVQNILGDLFASLTIVLDKPFVIGDFIVSGEHMGTVEHIGLKTTRVRSLSGEQLIFPNSDLLQSRIRNFKRMRERRVQFLISVTYQTPLEKLKEIPIEVQKIIQAHSPRTRFERAHFKQLAASSLDFEIVYWVLDPDMTLFMNIQQEINLALISSFAAKGIEFAYPTQTLFLTR